MIIAFKRVRDNIKEHKTKKKELKSGFYQSSQIEMLRIAMISSSSPKEVFF